jgi:hypothetical protein
MSGNRQHPDLLAAVIRFNAPLAGDFAPEALPEAAADLLRKGVLQRLEASRKGRGMVRAWLFRQLGVDGCFTDFREETRRLALLDRGIVRSLAILFGACVYAPEAARLVRREEAAALRACLGTYYGYALSTGRFHMQRARDAFASFRREDPLPERMAAAGFAALRGCLDSWPEPLARLAAPRLPAELRRGAATQALPLAHSVAAPNFFWPDLKKLLLTEVAPQWRNCFA